MKSIYIKKIIAGFVIFGSFIFFNSGSTTNDPEVFIGGIICFFLPAIVLGGIRLNIWIISYSLLMLFIWYTTIIPPSFKDDGFCGGIFCRMDDRPLIFIFLYFCALIILAIWQLISFIQKRNSKGLIQN